MTLLSTVLDSFHWGLSIDATPGWNDVIYEKLCSVNWFWILEVELGKVEKVATAVEASKKGKIDLKEICTLIIIISVLLPLLTHIISVLLPLLQPMQVLHFN